MRIVLDLQACQTPGSRTRGIGRYSMSLARAMIEDGRGHEFIVVLNGAFPEAAEAVRARLGDLLPPENFRTFDVLSPVRQVEPANVWRRHVSELARKAFLQSLDADVIHTSSLFEGLHEDAVTAVATPEDDVVQAVTLYDLIPYIKHDPYLKHPLIRSWYIGKIKELKRADILLAISESSRQEAIDHLHFDDVDVYNISCAIDDVFRPIEFSDREARSVLEKFGLTARSYVMYTGGIDYRKNIEGLIEAYAMLPARMRRGRNLAIVCSINDFERARLSKLALSFGLESEEVVFTGFVTEEDLVSLYNLCDLFIFPSLHEGFGLPVLEAMACGAPTLGADNSSIPEVVGLQAALFDSKSPRAIADKIEIALGDPEFSARLRVHGLKQARKFSWRKSAGLALDAMEDAFSKKVQKASPSAAPQATPRMAFISPLPPLQSGIADYAIEMLPELSRYYDIDLVSDQPEVSDSWCNINHRIISVAEFEEIDEHQAYDRIVYQVGNSEFHAHMIELMRRRPGVVVLHDYYLSGLQYWRSQNQRPEIFLRAIVETSGYKALQDVARHGPGYGIVNYPANAEVIRSAQGVIVHSKLNVELIGNEHAQRGEKFVRRVPQVRVTKPFDREEARRCLGLGPDDILIASFGIIAPTKLHHEILEGFFASDQSRNANCHLVFVGRSAGDYGDKITEAVNSYRGAANIKITGFADTVTYDNYLAASDIAIQLRAQSRGETSRAILDCFAHGVATIVNAHGTLAELDPEIVRMLPDRVSQSEIAEAIDALASDKGARENLGRRGYEAVKSDNSPAVVGRLYYEAIEAFSAHPLARERRLVRAASRLEGTATATPEALAGAARVLARSTVLPGRARLFVDISALVRAGGDAARNAVGSAILREIVDCQPDAAFLIEPVYFHQGAGALELRAARRYMFSELNLPIDGLDDEVIDPKNGDIFLIMHSTPDLLAQAAGMFERFRSFGVEVHAAILPSDIQSILGSDDVAPDQAADAEGLIAAVASSASQLIDLSGMRGMDLRALLDDVGATRSTELRIASSSGVGMDFSSGTRIGTLDIGLADLVELLGVFERVWEKGDVTLTIITSSQDEEAAFEAVLLDHAQYGRRLFWERGLTSPEIVGAAGSMSSLVAAGSMARSIVPLVKAADAGTPVLAFDIEAYRIALGRHAAFIPLDCPIGEAFWEWLTTGGDLSFSLAGQGVASLASQILAAVVDRGSNRKWAPVAGGRRYRVSHPTIGSSTGYKGTNFIGTRNAQGFLMHGPYVPLPAGCYETQLRGRLGQGGAGGAWIDITGERGTVEFARFDLGDVLSTQDRILTRRLPFRLERACEDLEVRLWVDAGTDLTFTRLDILEAQ